jgi:hypothetical protein
LELPNSHEQVLTLENLVEIQKQNTLEEAEEPKPGPEDRTVTVSELTEGLGFRDSGIRVFEGKDSNEQRRNREGTCLPVLKVKMRSLSTYVSTTSPVCQLPMT